MIFFQSIACQRHENRSNQAAKGCLTERYNVDKTKYKGCFESLRISAPGEL